MTKREAIPRTRHCWQPTELVITLLSANAREVVQRWISSSRFLDASNQPVLLPMASSDEAGFSALVGSVSHDLVPTVIFNELLRKGIVEQHESGCVLLRRSAYIPEVPHEEGTTPSTEEQTEAGRALRRRSNDIV